MVEDKEELPPILEDILPETQETGTALVPLSAAGEWHEIVDQIVDELTEEDFPDDVIKAAEYLMCGWPTYKVAQRLGRQTSTIRGYLSRYPRVAVAINYGQRELQRWRLSQLERQFISAVEASQDILDLGTPHRRVENLDGVDPKVLALKAQQARFIISLFAGQKLDLQVRSPEDEKPALKAQQDALDYIADKVSGRLESIEAFPERQTTTYRVVDIKDRKSGPMLDEHGDPMHGKLGIFDTNEEGTLCHVCGDRFSKIRIHVTKGHKMTDREYEMVFMFEKDALKKHDG